MLGCAFFIFVFVAGMFVDYVFIKGNPVLFDHHWVDYFVVGTITFMVGRIAALVEEHSKNNKPA